MRVESRERQEATEDSVRRAAVVATDTAAQQETLVALRSYGWSVVGVEAVVEDPFTEVAELTTGVDLSAIDVVLSVGGGSVTAIAIAVLAGVPLTPLGAVEVRRLQAIVDALDSGAAVHRPVCDLHVDGVRRLVTGPVEIRSHRPMEARLDERQIAVPAEATIRVTAELPMSGHLAVRVDGRLSNRAEHLHISCPDAPARLVASPRPQSFRELDVRLHSSHLHELLLS